MDSRLVGHKRGALPSSWRTPAVVVCRIRSLHLSRCCGRRPKPGNKHQYVPEHGLRNGDLGHLERHVTAMADDLYPILISFSRRLVSDQGSTALGIASV